MQAVVWQLTLELVGLVAIVFLLVSGFSEQRTDYEALQKGAYRIRALLFWGLIAIGVLVMAFTLGRLPYVQAHAGEAPQIVSVTGYQWYWKLDRQQVAIGQPVEFRVTSSDVNHGLGLYDPEMQLVAQTQAMPGYVNRVRYTFKTPGTYTIACLEYCGVAHHEMTAEITVVAP